MNVNTHATKHCSYRHAMESVTRNHGHELTLADRGPPTDGALHSPQRVRLVDVHDARDAGSVSPMSVAW